jgi:hypothetical protein
MCCGANPRSGWAFGNIDRLVLESGHDRRMIQFRPAIVPRNQAGPRQVQSRHSGLRARHRARVRHRTDRLR